MRLKSEPIRGMPDNFLLMDCRVRLAVTIEREAWPLSDKASSLDIEEGLAFAPIFDANGLITAVATDAMSGDVLMVAHMNAEALKRTIETGEAWYYSRSRKALWKKGESSGHIQRVTEMHIDCDQDAVWIKVEQHGPGACHTGRRSCFYRAIPLRQTGKIAIKPF